MAGLNSSQRKRLSIDIEHTFGRKTDSLELRFSLLGIEVFIDEDRTIRFTGDRGSEEIPGDVFTGRGFLPLMIGSIQVQLQAMTTASASSPVGSTPVLVQEEVSATAPGGSFVGQEPANAPEPKAAPQKRARRVTRDGAVFSSRDLPLVAPTSGSSSGHAAVPKRARRVVQSRGNLPIREYTNKK